MTVLVTGGTGTLGKAIVPLLKTGGSDIRVLSRSPRAEGQVQWAEGDLSTGKGITQAVTGIDAIVHLASLAHRGRRTVEVDVEGTRRLLDAARRAGVGHLIYVSIVGIDKAPHGYFKHKLETEALVRQGGIDWSILRATPFHPWIDRIMTLLARSPVIPVDRQMPWQPVDVGEVARRVARQLADGPSRAVDDFAGPHTLPMDELARQWLKTTGRRRALLPLRFPGRVSAAQRAGHLNGPPNRAPHLGRVPGTDVPATPIMTIARARRHFDRSHAGPPATQAKTPP
jgi:uncharacterized protein YbjT (DUF2867 family)